MSAATEFEPHFAAPARSRNRGARHLHLVPPGQDAVVARGTSWAAAGAEVTVLHRPSERSVAPPLRLTRRGVAVLAIAVGLLAAGLVTLAAVSVHGANASVPARAPASVLVRSGDTLWSIALRIAPDRDPRAEVDDLMHLNHLRSPALVPGEVLRAR